MPGDFRNWGLIAVLSAGLLWPAAAPSLAAQDVKNKLATSKAEAAKLDEKSKALTSELEKLRAKLVDSSKHLRQTERNLSDADQRLDGLQSKKNAYIGRLYTDHTALGGLISAGQKFSRTSLPHMLAQATPLQAARASIVMKSMIPALHQRTALLQQQIHEIETIEQDIAQNLSQKEKELHKINAQQEEIQSLLEKRKSAYQETEQDRRKLQEHIEKLAKEAKNLEDLVQKIKPKSKPKDATAFLPSSTLLPVSGKVLTGFGGTDALGAKSKGLTFRARAGASVVTPLSGTVKFAGPFQKFKQILIVEHQGGYHSLIAGLGRIDTVVGAELTAGEPVGTADTSSESAEVYYELRRDGVPVNPQNVLVAQRKQSKG